MTNTSVSQASVISFPKSRITREIPNETRSKLVDEAQKKSTKEYAATVSTDIAVAVYDDLKNYGLDMDTEQFNNDFAFLTNTIAATVYRMLDSDHPFQKVVDIVEFTDDEPVGDVS